jgi:hypothetical protein
MSNKSVEINPNPRGKAQTDSAALDSFVQGAKSPLPVPSKESMKRLTFDIPATLHKRIRRACLEKDQDMAAELRKMLMEKFPE